MRLAVGAEQNDAGAQNVALRRGSFPNDLTTCQALVRQLREPRGPLWSRGFFPHPWDTGVMPYKIPGSGAEPQEHRPMMRRTNPGGRGEATGGYRRSIKLLFGGWVPHDEVRREGCLYLAAVVGTQDS